MKEPMDRPPPSQLRPAQRVEIGAERGLPLGWEYDVALVAPDGSRSAHVVSLHWRDHDYWCGGASSPSKVILAVLEFVLANREGRLPPRFDAARARRWLPAIDQELWM
jgi:hypothetical protein